MKSADTPLDFDALLAHQDWLRGLVRSLVRDADQAEDVVQETWLAAIARPPTGSVRGFLRSVARNIALRRRRGDDARERRERAAARPEAGPSTDRLVEREAMRTALVREVIALTEPYRTAVVLRYFEGRKPAAIARHFGISVEATRRRLKAAEDHLCTRLRGRYGERWSTAILPLVGTGGLGIGGLGIVTSGGAVATAVKVAAAAAVIGGAYLLWGGSSNPPAGSAPAPAVETAAEEGWSAESDHADAGSSGKQAGPAMEPPGVASVVSPGPPLLVHGMVVAPDGAALPGARVRIRGYPRGSIHAEVACGADGRYAIHASLPGRGWIWVEAVAPGRGSGSHHVPVGTRLHFALEPAGRLEGRVVWSDGTPVGSGVELRASANLRYDARPGRAVTDEAGSFRIDALRPGPYHVSAGRGGTEVWRESMTHMRVTAGRTSRLVLTVGNHEFVTVTGRAVVREGERPLAGVPVTFRSPLAEVTTTTDADGRFRLERRSSAGTVTSRDCPIVDGRGYARAEIQRQETPAGLDFRLVFTRGTRVSGVVLGGDGAPVVGARYSSGNVSFSASGPRPTTDAAGRFSLVGSPGKHPLLLHIRVAEQYSYHYRTDVELAAGESRDDIEVRLPAGGAIEGVIRTSDGAAAAGARVEFRAVNEPRSHHGSLEAYADATGRYRVENLPPARYRAEVRVGGYPRYRPEVEVKVEARATAAAPDLILPAGKDLAGRVLDRAGEPVVGMQVNLRRPPREGKRHGEFFASAYSDHQGRFRLHGIPSGDLLVNPVVPGWRVGASVPAAAGDENVIVRTRPLARLTGRVTFADGGRPVVRFRLTQVRRVGVGQLQPTTTLVADPDGRFDLNLPQDGDHTLEVEARVGDVVHRGQADVCIRGRRAPPPLAIRLQRALAVTGFVRAPDGAPVAGAAVELRRPGGARLAPAYEATSAQDGRFSIDAVPPGDFVMECRHPDRVVSRRAIQLAPGGYPVQMFTLSETGGAVRVAVVGDEGRPVAGARVLVVDPDGELVAPHRSLHERAYFKARRRDPSLTFEVWHRAINYTDANGKLVRRFLPDGAFRVRVEAKGYRNAILPVAVRAGTVQDLRFVLLR